MLLAAVYQGNAALWAGFDLEDQGGGRFARKCGDWCLIHSTFLGCLKKEHQPSFPNDMVHTTARRDELAQAAVQHLKRPTFHRLPNSRLHALRALQTVNLRAQGQQVPAFKASLGKIRCKSKLHSFSSSSNSFNDASLVPRLPLRLQKAKQTGSHAWE